MVNAKNLAKVQCIIFTKRIHKGSFFMKYMGSKSKIAKYIIPIIEEYIDKYNISTYVEPFCGGCNIIDKVSCKEKIACDKQEYLIALLQNLDKLNKLPDYVSHEHYSDVRDCYNAGSDKYPAWYIGAIGFLASYNGRFFDGGYSGVRIIANGKTRDYYNEAKNNLIKQAPLLSDITFLAGDYKDTCSHFNNCLIYCDPPYQGTKQYGISANFDHAEFWDWCEEMSKNNIVLVSESMAGNNFTSIWRMPSKRTINNTGTKFATEQLFRFCG